MKQQFMRDKAEELAKSKIEASSSLSDSNRNKLLQELHVHQIELELQNEELRQSQALLAYTHQQYLDLYNDAPIGYASLDDTGLIVRANQQLATMLGVEKHTLNGRALAEYMLAQDQAIFRGRFKAFSSQPDKKHIDVEFRQLGEAKDKGSFVGRIQARRIASDELEETSVHWRETLLVVISDVTELKKSEAKVQFQAYHDSLTGLPNRHTLFDQLENSLSLAKRHKKFGALVFMDMDRFKNVNDSLGHHTGDKLLIEFTERLRNHIRREDLLVRMGGDEFVVLLAEQHSDKQFMAVAAQKFAEHIRDSLLDPISIDTHLFQLTVSIGISVFPFQENDLVEDVIRQADTAMYQAKNDGRGLVRFFHRNMQESARERMTLEAELRVALHEEQFELFYQPQMDVEGKLYAMEVLLRWWHPYRGIVMPDDFIHVAEENGMIVSLGEWVLESTVRQIVEWRKQKLIDCDFKFSVNISAKQLEFEGFVDKVEEIFKTYSFDSKCLIFEITESLLLPSDDVTQDSLERLSKLGITFAIDDFGKGYSSLAVMQTAPVSQLKIDKGFVEDLVWEDNAEDQAALEAKYALVNAILSLGKALNLEVVAEGVENRDQQRILQYLGCKYMQGYYLSEALPAHKIVQLFHSK
jgi:diguanylate cyclase (GGDEF)-like protein/PAS domain S-box-containing protein